MATHRDIIRAADRGVKTGDAWLGLGERLSDPKFWAALITLASAAGAMIAQITGWISGYGWAGGAWRL
jgi:hypothetical protein